MRPIPMILILAALAALAGGAAASEFCGGNGVIALSVTETVATTEKTVTVLAVTATLTDAVPVEGPGGVLLAIGGFEFALRVTGVEPLGIAKRVLVPHRDFGPTPAQIWAGVDSHGVRIDEGPVDLVTWTVTLPADAQNVRFDLDPTGLLSCKSLAGCPPSGASALYSGAVDVGQEGYLFGAGCRPAVHRPVGEPVLADIPCRVGVDEIGVFKTR